MARDDLDDLIAEREAHSPGFAALVNDHLYNREIIRQVAARRAALGLTQTQVAARMRTSQALVNRIERGETDPRISTVQRYMAACGQRLIFRLEEDPQLLAEYEPKGTATKIERRPASA